MVATAGLLSILGLPLEVQGYWTEHSERSVLPTGLSLMEVARGADRYDRLDEREIAADLFPWLMERAKLSREQAELTVSSLRRRWKEGDLGAEALAAEVSRRKKAEHQAKQITAAMEEAKRAAAKRREEALERLAKEEAEELRRY
eukprot:s11962_g1.t1